MDPKTIQVPDENWDYYSGLPNPSWYEEDEEE